VWPGGRELFVSGTASIAPDGRSAHVGDTRRQADVCRDDLRFEIELDAASGVLPASAAFR
jgi:hypothetical protein